MFTNFEKQWKQACHDNLNSKYKDITIQKWKCKITLAESA